MNLPISAALIIPSFIIHSSTIPTTTTLTTTTLPSSTPLLPLQLPIQTPTSILHHNADRMLQVSTLREQQLPTAAAASFPSVFKTPALVTLSDDESSVISESSSESLVETLPKSFRRVLNLGDIPTLRNRRPLIVGHRGALFRELENTLEGFQYCIDIGADAVELDVFYLAGELIVFHGGGTDKNPGLLDEYCLGEAEGRTIMDLTSMAQVAALTFNPTCHEVGCPPEKARHASIPTLRDVLQLIQNNNSKMVVKIEMKGEGTVEPSLQLVEEMGMQNQCHFASFYHDRVALVRQLHPERNADGTHVYRTGALFNNPTPVDFLERSIAIGASEVHLPYAACTTDRIAAIHAAGMGSMAWFRGPVGMAQDCSSYTDVGNEDERMYRTVMETGVEQMCCNRPDLLADMLNGPV